MENILLNLGHQRIAGIDEVGRGALAGPVVAAAVVLDPRRCSVSHRIRDSKRLSPETRDELFDILQAEALCIGIGLIHHDVIDQINILQATFLAMKEAISQLTSAPDICLVDGNQKIPALIRQICIPKGDDQITSIGAASIIAKVTRDRWMKAIAPKYPEYLFEQNKGYGTKDHLHSISLHGYTDIHRRSFQIKQSQGSRID